MTQITKSELMDYCDDLTKDGKELAIAWNGGGDDGYYEILLDNEVFESRSETHQALIDLAEKSLYYGSFDGNFSTDGKALYNRETKTFEGTDDYSEGVSDVKECDIEISLPKDIWFDSMEINVKSDSLPEMELNVRFVITNGPYIKRHADIENQISESLLQLFREHIEQIETEKDFEGIWQDFIFNYNDFNKKEKALTFKIDEFEYGYRDHIPKEIHISLID